MEQIAAQSIGADLQPAVLFPDSNPGSLTLGYHGPGRCPENLRHPQNFLSCHFLDMAMYPEELHRLHSIVAELYEKRIHAAGLAAADSLMIGENMGTQQGLLFSPAMFKQYFKQLYTRLIGIAHDYDMKVLMHSCGSNWQIIDDLLDVGVDCFQFDQPTVYDMPRLANKFRERQGCLWCPVDIQKVLPTGDKDYYIEAETERMCDIFEGMLMLKNYPYLPGIGVRNEWDNWAYNAVCRKYSLPEVQFSS